MRGARFKGDPRDNLFSQKVVDIWKELSVEVDEAAGKRHLTRYQDRKGLEGCVANLGE